MVLVKFDKNIEKFSCRVLGTFFLLYKRIKKNHHDIHAM